MWGSVGGGVGKVSGECKKGVQKGVRGVGRCEVSVKKCGETC